jgi:2'-5' RNA ligase
MGMQAHVTLLAPFTPPDQLGAGRMREVRDALAGFEPFDFELRETAYLGLSTRRVLYLRPEPSEPFLDLIEALRESFPEHPPYGEPSLKPIPHVTVATTPDDRLLERIERAIRPELPIEARAAEALIVEYGDDGCRTRSRIAFGECGR